MEITSIKIRPLVPPGDDLFAALRAIKRFRPKSGDIIAVSSKVVSIHEGRCVPLGSAMKDDLAKREAELFLERKYVPNRFALHTITRGVLIRNAGIDESNANGHYVLWPKDPMVSARKIRAFLKKEYRLKQVGVIITDSTSTPLRRGAMGFALGFAGFEPLHDYRGTKDIFGRAFVAEMANLADGLAAAAVLSMGEGSEQTPIAIIRNAPQTVWKDHVSGKSRPDFIVPLSDDIFSPFFVSAKWKRGGSK